MAQAVCKASQAVVATDRKVLVLKAGLTAGTVFGGKASSFAYQTIALVEVQAEILTSTSEIAAEETGRITLRTQSR